MAGEHSNIRWPEWKEEKLKELWLTELNTKEIAEKIGGVTHNAVISKAHTLKLPKKKRIRKKQPSRIKKPLSTLPYTPRTGFRPVPEIYFTLRKML